MPTEIHIVASCTDRKTTPVPRELLLRGILAPDSATRAARWWEHLWAHGHETLQAQELYAGDHWRIVQELPDLAREVHLQPHLWVASAGYGLLSAKALVRPYSATFNRGHADGVSWGVTGQKPAEVHREWWESLAQRVVPRSSEPRRLHQLAEKNPRAHFLVVASSSYLAVLEDDLIQTAGLLRSPEQLLIVSTPSPLARGALRKHWIPSSAHLQAQLGGARLSLHARVARDILQHSRSEADFLSAARVQEYYGQLIQRSPPPMRYERTPMTDDEVRQFISGELHTRAVSWSAALRRLRDSERACEQQRFKRLFTELRARP